MLESKLKQRILLADDDRNIADTLALILNATGYESKAVYSGESALQIAEEFKPDVLISDVIMTEQAGLMLPSFSPRSNRIARSFCFPVMRLLRTSFPKLAQQAVGLKFSRSPSTPGF